MIEIGIRELKARLSYYVQLMERGELIAVKVRDRVVGFFSNMKPYTLQGDKMKKVMTEKLFKKIERWKAEGILLSGGLCRPRKIEPVELKGSKTTAEFLKQIREGEE